MVLGIVFDVITNIFFYESIVSEAEAYAKRKGGWHTKRHEFYATTDLELTEIEAVSYFSLNLIYGEIIPLFNDVRSYHSSC